MGVGRAKAWIMRDRVSARCRLRIFILAQRGHLRPRRGKPSNRPHIEGSPAGQDYAYNSQYGAMSPFFLKPTLPDRTRENHRQRRRDRFGGLIRCPAARGPCGRRCGRLLYARSAARRL